MHSPTRATGRPNKSEPGVGRAKHQVSDAEQEPDPQPNLPIDREGAQPATSLSRWRAITRRWISLVPSPISQILASRIIRSTGYSLV